MSRIMSLSSVNRPLEKFGSLSFVIFDRMKDPFRSDYHSFQRYDYATTCSLFQNSLSILNPHPGVQIELGHDPRNIRLRSHARSIDPTRPVMVQALTVQHPLPGGETAEPKGNANIASTRLSLLFCVFQFLVGV